MKPQFAHAHSRDRRRFERQRYGEELIELPADDPIEVELYVRSIAPFGTRSSIERVIERLESLRAS